MHLSTQIGFIGIMSLSIFINEYVLLLEVPTVAVTISLNAALLILCRTFISRRRSPLATSLVILCSTVDLYYYLIIII